MAKFPVDAPRAQVVRAFEILGFQPDGTRTFLTLPGHPRIKGSTLRTICTHAGISRQEFASAFEQV